MLHVSSPDLFLVAVSGRRAGLLSRLAEGYRFHASNHLFDAMDGCRYASLDDARAAARDRMQPIPHEFHSRLRGR